MHEEAVITASISCTACATDSDWSHAARGDLPTRQQIDPEITSECARPAAAPLACDLHRSVDCGN